MQISIIIDRIDNINIYNVIEGNVINNPLLSTGHKLTSVVDDDLLQEYLFELNRVSNVARSLTGLSSEHEKKQAFIHEHLNLYEKIKQIGEVFYRQLFPESLREYLDHKSDVSIFFHVDESLSSIPFEILNDGNDFLWEKFRVGKTVKGKQGRSSSGEPLEVINMLIIADPTEDLEWARVEGETLLEQMSVSFPEKKLNIELLGGRGASKLTLLNALKDKDIVHYAGHLHYAVSPDENGWILFENKVLHSREIVKSGANPALIFSNSCASGRSMQYEESNEWYGQYASSFLKGEKTCYIGTNWQLPDSRSTLDFIIKFYEHLFNGKSVGLALQESRQFARTEFSINDLTWASYLLLGNPDRVIINSGGRIPDLESNMLDPKAVMEKYPFPIAKAFENFMDLSKKRMELPEDAVIKSLFDLAKQVIMFSAALIFGNLNLLRIHHEVCFNEKKLVKTLETLFTALSKIKALRTRPVLPNLMEVLYVHRDSLLKIARWAEEFEKKKTNSDDLESYEITVQYILETVLLDLESIRNFGFYRVMEPGQRQLSLQGTVVFHGMRDIILPTQANLSVFNEIQDKTTSLVGRCVFFSPIKRIFIDLSDYMSLKIGHTEGKEHLYDLEYNKLEIRE